MCVDAVRNGCTYITDLGSQACTKLGEAGGWIVEKGSILADKVKDFVMNTVWPALQQFWAWLTSLCSSAAHVAKNHGAEVGLIAGTAVAAGAAVGVGAACLANRASATAPAGAGKAGSAAAGKTATA